MSAFESGAGRTVDNFFKDIGEWFGWLTAQWWFWVIVVLIAIALVIALSMLLWGAVIAMTRWSFGTWRRALVAAPIFVTIVVLIIANAGAILEWVNYYWPLTLVPTLIVLAVPLIMLFGLFSSGGSGPSGGSGSALIPPGGCPSCGATNCAHHRPPAPMFDD